MATPERFVIESLFHIVNKDQEDVDFKFNAAQTTIDNSHAPRLIMPKARQEGVSMYFLARNAVRCMGRRNTRAVVISHDKESTEKLLARVKYFLDTLKGPKPLLKTNAKDEITFPKTNSTFYIGTAGSRAFGRGDTITDLHCSEVAYWPNTKRIMTGLLQAVPKQGGCISIESTGNGAGDWYHSQCMRAAKGESSFRMIFLPWQNFPEYTFTLTPDEDAQAMTSLRSDLNEPELIKAYNLTMGQILWRRSVIEDELDGDLYEWNKEYPSCLDDCFQVAGGGVFQNVNYIETPDWRCVDKNLYLLQGHPNPRLHYIIGGDVSAGVGKDSSVAEIFCLETEEQVGEFISNRIEPDVFGHKLAELGRLFNLAYLGVESNNHGILTLKELSTYDHRVANTLYPSHLVYRTPAIRRSSSDQVKRLIDLGVRTSVRSKPFIIGTLRKKLSSTAIIHSQVLRNELSTFVEHSDGSMGASDNCFDDTVMASGMAFFVFAKGAVQLIDTPISPEELPKAIDPLGLDAIIDEMTTNRSGSNSFFPSYLTLGL